MARLLYLLAGLATGVLVVGTYIFPPFALFGSAALVIAAVARVPERQAGRIALIGAAFVWSFYVPFLLRMASAAWNDRELHLVLIRWTPSSVPLKIENPGRLSPRDVEQIKKTGITGILTPQSEATYGSGKESRAILVMRHPVTQPVELREPNASIVYVQNGESGTGESWAIFPPGAHTLRRTIRIRPTAHDLYQSSIEIELSNGLSASGISWPKPKVPGR
jgi:hypothetical protein